MCRFKVYYITHVESGRIYVGITNQSVEGRFKAHTRAKSFLGSAIRKYGVEAFKVEILEYAESYEELQQKEIEWIKKLNTLDPNGFNLHTGGTGGVGWKPESESRLAMSIAKDGVVPWNKGKKGLQVGNLSRRKISDEGIRLILSSPNEHPVSLAKKLGVSRQSVYYVRKGLTFKNLTQGEEHVPNH